MLRLGMGLLNPELLKTVSFLKPMLGLLGPELPEPMSLLEPMLGLGLDSRCLFACLSQERLNLSHACGQSLLIVSFLGFKLSSCLGECFLNPGRPGFLERFQFGELGLDLPFFDRLSALGLARVREEE
jgi:hypothetical protein